MTFGEMITRGRQGEDLVRQWYKSRGYFVLPVALINSGGAPALEGELNRIIAANHLVFREGEKRWVEVKTFQRSTFNQRRQREEHGVSLRLWKAYKEGQELTGIKGVLCIVQVNEAKILEGTLDEIGVGAYIQAPTENFPPSGRQIFFDVRRFQWHYIRDIPELVSMLPKDLPPKIVRPWEQRSPASARQGTLKL